MDLGEIQHVKGIQIKAQSKNHTNPVLSFYLHYMSWNQWIPYQVLGKMKVLLFQFEHLVYEGNPN